MKKETPEKIVGEGSTVAVGHHICIGKYRLKSIKKKFKAGYHHFEYDGKERDKICYKRTK